MRFEIVVAPPASELEALAAPSSATGPSLRACRPGRPLPAREFLDVFIDGTNVTARARETHGAFVLRDLALALVELCGQAHAKRTVRFYDEPWEMCVERFGPLACVSVYRTGPEPQVTAYDRAVPFDGVVCAVLDAMDRLLSGSQAPTATQIGLASAAQELRRAPVVGDARQGAVPAPTTVVIDPDHDAHLSFGAVFSMRAGAEGTDPKTETIERADLHALLFRGRVRAQVRGRVVDLGECHPLLVAEQIIELARLAFDAWERGLALHARREAAGVLVGMRVATDGRLALTLGAAPPGVMGVGPPERRTLHTFPALGASDVLDAALAFGRSLVRAILRQDRAQSNNLRLGPLRRSLREANESLREASQTDSKVNPTPEPYRAFVAALDPTLVDAPSALPAGRLRYAPRWRAVVPGIDLRATYLCGDRLIVSSATEMWALDRAHGRSLWRTDIPRGASIITPKSIARLGPDGSLRVYDVYSGEVHACARIAARIGGPIAGAAVNLPGLPGLIVVTEGAHHLVAIDLATGEPRWRWSWSTNTGGRHGRGVARVKRAGRLVYFTCGDGALTALDVMTGAVVWRLRDRLRFYTPPTVTPDALFVVAGGAHGIARLYRVDPYSGSVRWSTAIGDTHAPCTVEGAPIAGAQAVAVTLRHRGGLALAPFHRESGAPVVARMRAVGPRSTSWLAVDDTFVGNAPNGELVAIDAVTGDLRWRQVLGPSPLEADVPRRLEPVLRCGALFVPHADVVVVRPRDGAVLGAISPTEAIPDLLRVDERCDVYVAEESGHILAFGALPRLALVKD